MDNKIFHRSRWRLLPVRLTAWPLALPLFYYAGDFTAAYFPSDSSDWPLRSPAWRCFAGQTVEWTFREGVFHVIHVSMPSLAVLIVVGHRCRCMGRVGHGADRFDLLRADRC